MPRSAPRWFAILALLLLPLTACGDEDEETPANNGPANNGATNNGGNNGATNNGNNGQSNNGPANNGPANNGPANNGPANNGPANNGPANNGPANNGPVNNGATNNGATNNGAPTDRFEAICATVCARAVTCGSETDATGCAAACVASPDIHALSCYRADATCDAIATCLGTPIPDPPTGDCADFDTNEPNDTIAAATPIGTATIDFVGLCAGDTDWYSVEVTTPETLIGYLEAIAITDGDPQADVTFELHDANGLVAASEAIGFDKAFDHTPTASGTFYIKVHNTATSGDGYIYALDYLVFDAGQ